MELGLLVVFQTDTGDEIELGFQPVHMLLFIFQDLLEQVAADVVLHRLGIGDGDFQVRGWRPSPETSQRNISSTVSPMRSLPRSCKLGSPSRNSTRFDQLVGMFHLIDGFVILLVPEPLEAPVIIDAGMQEVLVDGNQLIGQHLVEVGNDFGISFHRHYSSFSSLGNDHQSLVQKHDHNVMGKVVPWRAEGEKNEKSAVLRHFVIERCLL